MNNGFKYVAVIYTADGMGISKRGLELFHSVKEFRRYVGRIISVQDVRPLGYKENVISWGHSVIELRKISNGKPVEQFILKYRGDNRFYACRPLVVPDNYLYDAVSAFMYDNGMFTGYKPKEEELEYL